LNITARKASNTKKNQWLELLLPVPNNILFVL
jgi:hypothetical protein